jgi:N-acetylglutamate synthase-like GNAT family acetyltransferase
MTDVGVGESRITLMLCVMVAEGVRAKGRGEALVT